MEQLIFTATEQGFALQDNGITYFMSWVGDKLLVHGGSVCYYLMETTQGLEKLQCSTKAAMLILGN